MNPHELAIQAQVAAFTWHYLAWMIPAVVLIAAAMKVQARRYWAGRRSTFKAEVRQHASRQLKRMREEVRA